MGLTEVPCTTGHIAPCNEQKYVSSAPHDRYIQNSARMHGYSLENLVNKFPNKVGSF